ncbi:S8 family peptidase [bacterium]|nr:S8 family peptidase [bacterium]
MSYKITLVVVVSLLLLVLSVKPVEAYNFNGRVYEQLSGEWYEVYQDVDFKVVGTEILVEFSGTATQTQIDNLIANLLCETVRVLYNGVYLVQYITTPPVDPLDLCQDFLDETLIVLSAKNNTEGKAAQPADEYYGWQFYLNDGGGDFDDDINFETAWEIENGDPSVKIGIIDDGLLWTHPDIDGLNIWQNVDAVEDDEDFNDNGRTLTVARDGFDPGDLNASDDDGNNLDDDLIGWSFTGGGSNQIGDAIQNQRECEHGTRIAAIIGAMTDNNDGNNGEFAGIAGGDGEGDPGCSIVFCKVSDNYPLDRIRSSLNYLIQKDVDIINISFIMAQDDVVEDLLETAEANGILVCCASGNEADDEVAFPANYETTVAVGASYHDERWNASNYGEALNITAPTGYNVNDYLVYINHTALAGGWEIGLDPDNDGVEDCYFDGGTSAACACVSAVAGLLLSKNNELEPADLKEILSLTATRDLESDIQYDGDPGTWDEEMGYGDLDAGEAVLNCDRLEVPLDDGWTMKSTNIMPYFTPGNGLDEEPEGVLCTFWELAENLVLLKDENGDFWKPDYQFNNIQQFNYQRGYQICMDGGDNSWVSLGKQVPYYEEIELLEGWNIVAYFPEGLMTGTEAFESIVENLDIVQDEGGNYYWPEWDFDGLTGDNRCCPGKGYQVKVTAGCTLEYPDNGDLESFSGGRKNSINNEHFRTVRRTDHFHPILLTSISVENVDCERGDEIAVFSPDGLCIGASVYNGELPMGLPVWRDDTLTVETDGYLDMETFYLRYWDANRNVEIGYDSLNIFSNLDSYEEEPPASAHNLIIGHPENVPGTFELEGNYPNPFNSETIINYSITKTGAVSIVVYDVQGRKIRELTSGQQIEGKHHVVWDGCNTNGQPVSSGIYLYRITYESGNSIIKSTERKMMMIR